MFKVRKFNQKPKNREFFVKNFFSTKNLRLEFCFFNFVIAEYFYLERCLGLQSGGVPSWRETRFWPPARVAALGRWARRWDPAPRARTWRRTLRPTRFSPCPRGTRACWRDATQNAACPVAGARSPCWTRARNARTRPPSPRELTLRRSRHTRRVTGRELWALLPSRQRAERRALTIFGRAPNLRK